MIEELAEFLPMGQLALWSGFVVFLRLGAMMAVLPVFGEQTISVRIRVAISLAFTVVVTPTLGPTVVQMPASFLPFLSVLAPEIVSGLFFGLLLRFFVLAIQTTGSIAAQSTSLSQIFGGSAGADPQPAMAHVLLMAALALAALMGLHIEMVRYMLMTYDIVPMGALLAPEIVADFGVQNVSRCFRLGFILAAPFVIASLIYNVTLGVINRAMPQLMVSFVGAPAITAGGLLLLFLTAPIMLSIWIGAFSDFVANPTGGF